MADDDASGTVSKSTISVAELNDGSTMVEWIGDGWRMGVVLNVERGESSWYYVSHSDAQSGRLPAEFWEAIEEIGDVRAVKEIEARIVAGTEEVLDWSEIEAEQDRHG